MPRETAPRVDWIQTQRGPGAQRASADIDE